MQAWGEITSLYLYKYSGMNFMRRRQAGQHHLLQGTKGVSVVEFALVLPMLLLLVCGIMDFGNLYLQWNIASQAAREGARMAAITLGTTQAQVTSYIHTKYGNQLNVTLAPTPTIGPGTATVTVTNSVQLLTPIIKPFFGNNGTVTVTGQSVMQVEN